jgi:MFS family permease
MVLLIAIGRGVMMSFNQPARQSLISELVPHGDLMNAIALNSATLNLTRVIGPAIGGVLIVWVGVAGAFYLNAASFLAVLYGLSRMRFSERTVKARRGVVHDLVEGVRYLNGQPALRTLVVLALVPMVLGMPYMTMLTVCSPCSPRTCSELAAADSACSRPAPASARSRARYLSHRSAAAAGAGD